MTRLVTDAERRARLTTRQALHPEHRADDVVAAARAVVCLHATEAATVHLAVGARTTGVTPSDVEGALYDDRSIVKQLAMRRTLFAFPRDLLPAALAVARERIAPEQHRLIVRDATRHGIADDGAAWLETAGAAVERRLAGGEALLAQLRQQNPDDPSIPALAAQVVSWAASPYYAAPGKIRSVEDAIVRVLGFDLVINLALGLALGKSLSLPKDHPQQATPYWQQSIYTAAVIEGLIRAMPRAERPEAGLTYLGGWLAGMAAVISTVVLSAIVILVVVRPGG